jgi:hypothetical protein
VPGFILSGLGDTQFRESILLELHTGRADACQNLRSLAPNDQLPWDSYKFEAEFLSLQ